MVRRFVAAVTAAVLAYVLDGDIAKYIDVTKKHYAVHPAFCEPFTPCVIGPRRENDDRHL